MSSPGHSRCLLVEDVDAMRALLSVLLEGGGCEVFAAGSLGDARRMLKSRSGSPFDIVVLDLQLPDGDGLALLPEIDQKTNVVALTADDSRETYLQCINAGCGQVLSKSGDLTKLREILTGTVASTIEERHVSNGSIYPYMRYLAEVRLDLEEVRQKTDLLGLRRIAHRLRGTAIHFGYPGIGRAAKSVSVAIAAGNLDQVDMETLALREHIAQALEVFYLRERNAGISSASPSMP
jgi:CheY-like chemotaxis protein